mgnify:CR=1 FL=1
MSKNLDEKYMRMCFTLAKRGLGRVSPNPLVGCVILDKNGNYSKVNFINKTHNFTDEDYVIEDKKIEFNYTLGWIYEDCYMEVEVSERQYGEKMDTDILYQIRVNSVTFMTYNDATVEAANTINKRIKPEEYAELKRQLHKDIENNTLLYAFNKFLPNIDTVIGPTPPGTGVMYDAFFSTSSKHTSPQSLPSSLTLIPTSMTI